MSLRFKEINLCIVGGGNLSHVCIGALSKHDGVRISLLTNHPEKWNKNIEVYTPEGLVLNAEIDRISSDPSKVVSSADIVLLCLPAFCVADSLTRIKPFIRKETIVGAIVSNSGFFILSHNILGTDVKLFGFQRVPYVSRITEYGRSAHLLGYRDELFMATENIEDREGFRALIEEFFGEKTTLVDSYYEVTLSNSNPILHTGRLYTMWKDWDGTPFETCSLFYKEWTDECSELEVEMDREFFCLLEKLNVNTSHIETLLLHYESETPHEMTEKIKSIKSLSTILSPMKQSGGYWYPDFSSRYFTEDFPYGLKMIKDLAVENSIETPAIDRVLTWGLSKITQ